MQSGSGSAGKLCAFAMALLAETTGAQCGGPQESSQTPCRPVLLKQMLAATS